MAQSRGNEDKQEEMVYSIIGLRKNRLFPFEEEKQNTYAEKNQREADILNAASVSCRQFTMTPEEEAQLLTLKQTKAEIQEKVKALGLLQKETNNKIKDLEFPEDKELAALVRSKISTSHDVLCHVDRAQKLVRVTINACKDQASVEELFKSHFNNELWIQSEGNSGCRDWSEKIVVRFRLRHREEMMSALTQRSRASAIPVAYPPSA